MDDKDVRPAPDQRPLGDARWDRRHARRGEHPLALEGAFGLTQGKPTTWSCLCFRQFSPFPRSKKTPLKERREEEKWEREGKLERDKMRERKRDIEREGT